MRMSQTNMCPLLCLVSCASSMESVADNSNRPLKRRRLATSLGHFLDAEQVQEQEQEREQQQEQEVRTVTLLTKSLTLLL